MKMVEISSIKCDAERGKEIPKEKEENVLSSRDFWFLCFG